MLNLSFHHNLTVDDSLLRKLYYCKQEHLSPHSLEYCWHAPQIEPEKTYHYMPSGTTLNITVKKRHRSTNENRVSGWASRNLHYCTEYCQCCFLSCRVGAFVLAPPSVLSRFSAAPPRRHSLRHGTAPDISIFPALSLDTPSRLRRSRLSVIRPPNRRGRTLDKL